MNLLQKDIKLVIFDVDGTLYDQNKLRKKMIIELLFFYLIRPWRVHEINIIMQFRKEREKKAHQDVIDIEEAQYRWCADKTGYSAEVIKKVIEKWIYNEPLKYMKECIYPGLKNFFETLAEKKIKIAIWSDYKPEDKISALRLFADLQVCSTDSEIDRLKPNPAGLKWIMKKFEIKPEHTLFIGDREEIDGQCAKNAGVKYLNVDKSGSAHFFPDLKKQLFENND